MYEKYNLLGLFNLVLAAHQSGIPPDDLQHIPFVYLTCN
jgi:hypothetical protein